MAKNMVFGANEATNITNEPKSVTPAEAIAALKFGKGAYDLTKLTGLSEDGKVRFVYDAETSVTGGSGMVYVGDKLVSSRILDVTPVATPMQVYNKETGVLEPSDTATAVESVKVKYVDTDNSIKETTVTLIDRASVEEMIKVVTGDTSIALETVTDHLTDPSTLLNAENGAVTVTVSTDPSTGFVSHTVKVNTAETKVADAEGAEHEVIKVVDDKVAVATYAVQKVADPDAEYAAQYKLMMTAPGEDDAVQVGDTINIMKDMVVQSADVRTFNYVKNADNTYSIPAEEPADGTELYAHIGEGETDDDYVSYSAAVWNHSYLHLGIITRPDEGGSDTKPTGKTEDVYLDFTQIYGEFASGDEFIVVDNGIISLDEDKVTEYVDASLAYVTNVAIAEPKSDDASLFNSVTVTQKAANSKESTTVTFDIANAAYYTALNSALDTLQANDNYLAGLLTWEEL